MISAFGVVHKAQARDAKGRFARVSGKSKSQDWRKPKPRLSDEEYELEVASLHDDIKQLYRAEGDDKRWQHWKGQLKAAEEYYAAHDESELIDDIYIALHDSTIEHKAALKRNKKP